MFIKIKNYYKKIKENYNKIYKMSCIIKIKEKKNKEI